MTKFLAFWITIQLIFIGISCPNLYNRVLENPQNYCYNKKSGLDTGERIVSITVPLIYFVSPQYFSDLEEICDEFEEE